MEMEAVSGYPQQLTYPGLRGDGAACGPVVCILAEYLVKKHIAVPLGKWSVISLDDFS